jgi:hypothetical protein
MLKAFYWTKSSRIYLEKERGKMRTEQEIKWCLEAIHRDMKLAEYDVKSKDIELSEFAIEQLKELSIKERILMWVMNGE